MRASFAKATESKRCETNLNKPETGIKEKLMELFKNYKVVISVVLIVLVLVVIRSAGVNHFKSDAKKWAEPSFRQSNTLTMEQARLLKGKILAINLDKEATSIGGIPVICRIYLLIQY